MTVVQNIKKKDFFFSEHASEQLHSRSKMSRSEVMSLLSNNITIPVGVDKHRVHTVIYSIKDEIPLVIVYDERNGEIVTVLYLEYNNKFVIHPDIADNIKNLTLAKLEKPARKETIAEKTAWLHLYPEVRQCPEVTDLIRLYFKVKTGTGFKEVEFITLNPVDFGGDVSKIAQMQNIRIKIENGRIRKDIAKLAIDCIFTRLDTGRVVKLGCSRDYSNMIQAELNAEAKKKAKKAS